MNYIVEVVDVRVREVKFEKLFSIGNYNNERIGFVVELADGEDENKVLGELYFKVCNIEDCLERYRSVVEAIGNLHQRIRDKQQIASRLRREIEDLKTTVSELAEKAKSGDIDARLRHACESRSYKGLIGDLRDVERRIEELNRDLDELNRLREELRNRIKSGNFSFRDLDFGVVEKYVYREIW